MNGSRLPTRDVWHTSLVCGSAAAPPKTRSFLVRTMNATNHTTDPNCGSAGDLALGLLLTLAGAILLALSMVTQRFALSHKDHRIRCCRFLLPRDVVWFGGLVVYGAANALKIVAQPYAPFSVLSSIWTTLLVFNLGLSLIHI